MADSSVPRSRLLGDFFRKARIKAKVKQIDIARASEVHPQFISNIERGVCSPPGHIIVAYAELCQISSKKIVKLILLEKRAWIEEAIIKPLRARSL